MDMQNIGCLIEGLSWEQIGRLRDLMGDSGTYYFHNGESVIGFHHWEAGAWFHAAYVEIVSYDELINLLEPKSKRHPHRALIYAWANGAEVGRMDKGKLHHLTHPSWYEDAVYEIMTTKTPKQIKIDKLEAKLAKLKGGGVMQQITREFMIERDGELTQDLKSAIIQGWALQFRAADNLWVDVELGPLVARSDVARVLRSGVYRAVKQ